MGKPATSEVLSSLTLFRDLPAHTLEGVAALCSEQRLVRDQVLFMTGDPGDRLYLITQGWVRVTRLSQDGREKTLAILGEGDCLGEMALLDGAPRSATARAVTACTVVCLERARFMELLDGSPAVSFRLLMVMASRLREANAQIEELTFHDARSKVAAALLQLGRHHGVPGPAGKLIPLRLTHQELASLAGTSRETASRVLAELLDDGCLGLQDGRFVLRDGSAQATWLKTTT